MWPARSPPTSGSRLFGGHARSASAAAAAPPEVLFTSAGLVVRPAHPAAAHAREVQSMLDHRRAREESESVVINGNVYETHSGTQQRLPSSVQGRAQSSSFASHFASPSRHTRSRTVGHGNMQPRQLFRGEEPTTQEEPESYFGLGRSSSQTHTAGAATSPGDRVSCDSFAHPLLGGSGSPVRLPPGRNFHLASAQRSVITHYTERADESTGSAGVDLRQELHTTVAGSAVHVAMQMEDRIAGVTRRAELRALGDRANAQVHTRSTSDQHGGWTRDEQLLRNLPADDQSTERATFDREWHDASAAMTSATHLPSLMHSPVKAVHAHRTFTHEVSSPTRRTVEQWADGQSVLFDRQGRAHTVPTAAAVGSSPSSASPPVASSPVGSPQRSPMRSPMSAAGASTGASASAPRTPTRSKGPKSAGGSGAAR